ncbi:F-box LRR-repeat 12 [Brachionus plicatilis]|uniref:F-box LRR-repeat 12 n=1 Tax=Brachionus plicatilis TaxID=10195 RepID=A0A3M7PLN3_BRAPC|nr:F-box LRR-repeat 12 [Brachionus plicatilis]
MGELNENHQNLKISILDLPDIFMISVFELFSMKKRLQISRVCKKWNSLVKDASLWAKFDFRDEKNGINLDDIKNIILLYGSESSKQLFLAGNYSFHFKHKIDEKATTQLVGIDTHFLKNILPDKCSNMDKIVLEYLDLSSLIFQDFSFLKELKILSFKWCNMNQIFFNINDRTETKIEQLYLIKSGNLTVDDVKTICWKMPYLNTLCINQAQSSINDDSIHYMVKHLINLESLELTNTLISDMGIQSICESPHLAKNLKFLNISMSSCLTNSCLNLLSEHLSCLKSLYLTSCFGISNVQLLQNFVNLSYLNLNNTSIEREKIRESLLPVLPKCEIDFGHEKMLNRKLMWTINGSRNCVCSF